MGPPLRAQHTVPNAKKKKIFYNTFDSTPAAIEPFGKGVRIEENGERFFLPAGAPARCLKHENRAHSLMVPLPHLNENHFRSISGGPFGKGALQVGTRVPDFCFLGSGGNSQNLRLPNFRTFLQPKSLIGSQLGGALKDF
jgi:hypothetical protein